MIRIAYPHDRFPDEPYERTAKQVEEAATDAIRAIDQQPFFRQIHATTVVALYDDREVWALLGYEGSSFDHGGYSPRRQRPGNASRHVGCPNMRHMTGSAHARVDKPVHMYRGEPMAGMIADGARHIRPEGSPAAATWRPSRWGRRSWRVSSSLAPGAGSSTELMDVNECTAGMWIVGEDMPQSSNRVSLSADVTDELGLPVPHLHRRSPQSRSHA